MMFAYARDGARLRKLTEMDFSEAVWIDLYRPLESQVAAVTALGIEVPTLADMEEIEISKRLYRENGVDYLTVVLPGLSETKEATSGPVCFILTKRQADHRPPPRPAPVRDLSRARRQGGAGMRWAAHPVPVADRRDRGAACRPSGKASGDSLTS